MININKFKINSLIIALYIFQFGFLQPLAIFFNSQIPIAFFTVILVLIMLLNNKFKIKRYIVITLLIISFYFLFNSLILYDNRSEIFLLFIQFLMKSFSAFMIGSLEIDESYFYKVFLRIAFVNFIVLLPLPFMGMINEIGYMRYGYAMAPSVLALICEIYNNKKSKIVWILLAILSLSITLIYGSRGPLVGFLLYFLIIFVLSDKINKYKKILVVMCLGLTIFLTEEFRLIQRLLDYLYYSLDLKTYSLAKFRMMIANGLIESSSGRDIIYLTLLHYIKNNLFFGYGVAYSNIILGYTPHNIMLQVLIESGIFGLIVWMSLWIYFFHKLRYIHYKQNKKLSNILISISSLAIGRLLVSSDMWIRPEYWLVISIIINYKIEEKKTYKYQKV